MKKEDWKRGRARLLGAGRQAVTMRSFLLWFALLPKLKRRSSTGRKSSAASRSRRRRMWRRDEFTAAAGDAAASAEVTTPDVLVSTAGRRAAGNGGSVQRKGGCEEVHQEGTRTKVQHIYPPRGLPIRARRRKKLLILDLNGLLADINQDYHSSHLSNGEVRGKLVFKRPYCDDFLRFCVRNFELGIWSSRLKANTDAVVDILMKDLKQHLLFCWDASKCTATGHYTVENRNKPLVLKELKKLWNKEEPDLPWQQGEFSPSNTLLVDDSPYKALRNPPHTAIFPYSYSYKNEKDDSLGPGGDLRLYLENLATADDVQRYVRKRSFGQLPITERNPNWNLYAKILDGRFAQLA